jgi:hypothetical protein
MSILSHIWNGFEWFGISVTDWSLAFAASIGTYFAAVGYMRLIKIDARQQQQIDKQQFENAFLKLVENHSFILKSFEVNVPTKVTLDSYVKNLKYYCEHYNLSMNSNEIIGVQLFNFHPKEVGTFQDEAVKKVVTDINHISNFVLTKQYLTEADRYFYFTTLFNSLYECEKYLYGYQSELQYQEFFEKNSEYINSFNNYFNSISDNKKIKLADENKFYPTMEFFLSTGGMQNSYPFLELHNNHPQLVLINNNPLDIFIGEVYFVKQSEINIEDGFQIKNSEPFQFKINQEISIDLFEAINHFYFENNLTELLNQPNPDPINKALDKIRADNASDRWANLFVIKISITATNKKTFDYYAEFILDPPETHNHYFNIRLHDIFNNQLIEKIKMKNSLKKHF